MSDRPTPETDAVFIWEPFLEVDVNKAQILCEKLERERDELREEVASLRLEAKYHDEADALRKFRERERDEAREDLEFRRGLYKVQEECLDRAKRERDEAQAQVKLADTPKTDAYQYADYILNHYDRNSHMDKLCLAKSLVENGYGSKAAEIKALSEKEKAIRERDEARVVLKRIYQASIVAQSLEEDFAEWEKAIEMLLDLLKKEAQ